MERSALVSVVILFAFFLSPAYAQTVKTYSRSNFEFKVYTDNDTSGNGVCSVDSVVITSKHDPKFIQVIVPGENSYRCNTNDDPISIGDMNFDGFEDFRVIQFTGSPNTPYYFWLYDLKNKKFKKSAALEDITSPSFDQKNKCITSDWTDNAAHHGTAVYRYINGKLTKTKEIDKNADPKDSKFMIVTTKEMINGKWKVVSRSRAKWD